MGRVVSNNCERERDKLLLSLSLSLSLPCSQYLVAVHVFVSCSSCVQDVAAVPIHRRARGYLEAGVVVDVNDEKELTVS
jgi:hypothetical protein